MWGKKNNALSSKNIKTYNINRIDEIINKKGNKRKSGFNAKASNNNNSKKNVYYQVKYDNLDIYERANKNIERKKKYIAKQKQLQEEKMALDYRDPEIHEMSEVMKDYTPIYERDIKLHKTLYPYIPCLFNNRV